MTRKEALEIVCPRVLTRRKFCNVGKREKDEIVAPGWCSYKN
jgi:hypothetical protein